MITCNRIIGNSIIASICDIVLSMSHHGQICRVFLQAPINKKRMSWIKYMTAYHKTNINIQFYEECMTKDSIW